MLRAVAVICLSLSPPAIADEIHLTGGGMIEGIVLADSADGLRIQTPSGQLVVPAGIVARRVTGPTRWTRYQRELAREPLDAPRHVELASWCDACGLEHRRQEHLAEALRLDPTLPDALRESGYAPVGDVWIQVVPPPSPADLERANVTRREQQINVIRQLIRGWQLRVRELVAEDRDQVLALTDPLTLPALCAVLTEQQVRCPAAGNLLVKLLAGSDTDTAALNLFVLALLHDDSDVRLAAVRALADRQDPRVSQLLRTAVHCRADTVVRRAAIALGEMHDRSAVPDLTEALTVREAGDGAPDVHQLLETAAGTLAEPLMVPLGEHPVAYPSEIAVALPDGAVTDDQGPLDGGEEIGTVRTEVQEALIAITGKSEAGAQATAPPEPSS